MHFVVAVQQNGHTHDATYLGLTIAQWVGVLFGSGVVITFLTKVVEWWQSRPLFKYSSDPKVDEGSNFVASITQRRNATGVIIAASVVVTVSRWYRWLHKIFHWGDAMKDGIVVSEPSRMVLPNEPVALTANQNHALSCSISKEVLLPARWKPWSAMSVRTPKSSELRSAVQATSRSPRYKRVSSERGYFAERVA
jgi:hypothetical protein